MRVRETVAAGLAALLSAALGIGVCGQAQATKVKSVTVTAETNQNTGDSKSVYVLCPTGKHVIDAGGYILGQDGHESQVHVDAVEPSADRTHVYVHASEDADGFTSADGMNLSWRLVGTAVCA
ncbi:hypothetical protein [Streptomyces sp. NPDC053431]|uniref:hypothetical protein n=1 Tax=Streptomyces sp. NPDC053431 TaxID=3365703 RepID=UPI0037D533B0